MMELCCESMRLWIDGDLSHGQVSPVFIRTDAWEALDEHEQKRRYPDATGPGWYIAVWNRRFFGQSGYRYKRITRCQHCGKDLQ